MIFSGKELGTTLSAIFSFSSTKCVPVATNMNFKLCIIFLFVSSINAYKCHIINFLFTSLALYMYTEKCSIGPWSFCTNLALWARSVQKGLGTIFLCTDLAFGF